MADTRLVTNCVHCEEDHSISFVKADEYLIEDWTHIGICENTDEPVVMGEFEGVCWHPDHPERKDPGDMCDDYISKGLTKSEVII